MYVYHDEDNRQILLVGFSFSNYDELQYAYYFNYARSSHVQVYNNS